MLYQLKITNQAKREIRRLPAFVRQQVIEVVKVLKVDPQPPESEPLLRQLKGRYKIRIDGYRIIYRIQQDDKAVQILTVRARDQNTYLNVP